MVITGKVCNAATGTLSTMGYYICVGKPLETSISWMKSIWKTQKHWSLAWLFSMRGFGSLNPCSMWIYYQLGNCKRNQLQMKRLCKEQKKKNIIEFRQAMGPLVDVPKAGFANINDGYTSWRVFADSETSLIWMRITKIEMNLINRMWVMQKVFFPAARKYVELYEWDLMSPIVHKILMHGAQVIRNAVLPI